ncbi:MAG: glycosyltransferase family 2 protein [Betaproteobacteria bacterium]|nr:glycosyltransferase family 2 protein [Betaproteobacteria bacterium]
MLSPPVVSVVMAMRNAEASIAMTLQSLLDQSFTDWELLLLDDGSSDGSLAMARRFDDPRILIRADGRRLGLAARLNQAVTAARGRYIARMDADDVAYPERFAKQVEFLDQHPEVNLLGAAVVVFSEDGNLIGALPVRTSHREIAAHPWAGFYLPHPTWMGRREWFVAHAYDPRSSKSQDYDLLLRSHAGSCFACLPEVLLGYRQEHLSLGKILASRIQTSRSILRHGWNRKIFHPIVPALAGQAAKFAMDVLAISSGLDYRLLRHRALAVSPDVRAQWSSVWQQLKSEVDAKCAA